jgi:hypothetical protein
MMVKGITKDNILMGLIPNMMMIYKRYIRLKILGLEINDDVSIPYIIWADQKERFIRKIIFYHILCIIGGKVTYQLSKDQRFLWLGFLKLQIKLLENHNPLGVYAL